MVKVTSGSTAEITTESTTEKATTQKIERPELPVTSEASTATTTPELRTTEAITRKIERTEGRYLHLVNGVERWVYEGVEE